MLNENLKRIRKEKGFTQEILALRLNVVRQTVSKWEKGISVPDAEMLQKIAEVLDVDTSILFGGEIPIEKEDRTDIANELAKINEHLAKKAKKARIIKRIIFYFFFTVGLTALTLWALIKMEYISPDIFEKEENEEWASIKLICTIKDSDYPVEIFYATDYINPDYGYNVISGISGEGGDYFKYHVVPKDDEIAEEYVARLCDYCYDMGGDIKIVEFDGYPAAWPLDFGVFDSKLEEDAQNVWHKYQEKRKKVYYREK